MSEIMDDYDAGFEAGKEFAQKEILKLMNEVIQEYKLKKIRMDSPSNEISQAQLNSVEFMKGWILSGGHEDENGNRVCLAW